MSAVASVIIPAHDEAGYIEACLQALLATNSNCPAVEVIVVANGCTDDTAALARKFTVDFAARGWALKLIETKTGSKPDALNLGDAAAASGNRIYLDADVVVSPELLCQFITALDQTRPVYVGGTPVVTAPRTGLSKPYARFWSGLPFVVEDVPGFGIFAVNASGRMRWGDFPDVISDDTFVRLNFTKQERVRVSAEYHWPIVDGVRKLIQVRRRQDRGVNEISAKFPGLVANDRRKRMGLGALLGRLLRDPVGFAVYGAVSLAVRMPLLRTEESWARGR